MASDSSVVAVDGAGASSAAAKAPAPAPASAAAPITGGGYKPLKGAAKAKAEEKRDEGESGPDNLKSGTRVVAIYRDGTERRARVLERRPVLQDGQPTAMFRYYIHWLDFNRRMDSWVEHDRIRFDPEGQLEDKEEQRKRDAAKKAATVAVNVVNEALEHAGGKHGKMGKHGKHGMGGSGGSAAGGAGGHGHSHSDAVHGEEQVDETGTIFRGRKRAADGALEINFVEPEHSADGMNEDAIREHEDVTKMKNVNKIELGRHIMETWYFSPLPKEYWPEDFIDTLYFCEFCLKFFRFKSELGNHCAKCKLRHPPGDEIYRGPDGLGMWEIDGTKEKQYCQNLCYLAKMFLDHKTLNYDVDLFMFYVMTEVDEHGFHIVGYYSKEKYSDIGYNLACILALPCYQKRGYGRFLIQFSYELSKIEKKVGHPEKPLSDLGLLSYRSYWTWVLTGLLRTLPEGEEISIFDVMTRTSIRSEDIIATLQHLGLLKYQGGNVVINYNRHLIEDEFKRLDTKPYPRVEPSLIDWTPLRNPLPQGVKKDKWLISSKLAEAGESDGGR